MQQIIKYFFVAAVWDALTGHRIGGRTFLFAQAHHVLTHINAPERPTAAQKRQQIPVIR